MDIHIASFPFHVECRPATKYMAMTLHDHIGTSKDNSSPAKLSWTAITRWKTIKMYSHLATITFLLFYHQVFFRSLDSFCLSKMSNVRVTMVGEFCSTCTNLFRSVNFCCTWATPECSVEIMLNMLDSVGIMLNMLDSVGLGIREILSLLWLCFFKDV
jgi:hypothetical protein